MTMLWALFSLLFFISLAMFAASIFTPRTAIFFKEKTKARGALIWLIMVGICALAIEQVATPELEAPTPSQQAATAPGALPAYTVEVSDIKPGQSLTLEGTLAKEIDLPTLRSLGEKVYVDNKGKDFPKVYMLWYLPGHRKGAGAWGVTHVVNGKWEVEIPALQK